MQQQKITLGEMRSSGVSGLLVYCADYKCSHTIKLEAVVVDRWEIESGSPTSSPASSASAAALEADIRPNFAPARMGTTAW
jgi:hypothetical protein